jgi:hypothetical protein
MACTLSPSRIVVGPDPPEGIDLVAVIAEDGDGRAVGAAGLSRAFEPLRLPDEIDGAAFIRVVGYATADLAGLVLPDGDLESGLHRAEDGDPILPSSRWHVGGALSRDGRAELFELPPARPLVTADWLPPCPILLPVPTTLVDSSCTVGPCAIDAVQTSCEVSITGTDSECTLELAGSVDGRGRVFFDGCAPADTHDGAAFSVDCAPGTFRNGVCNLEVYASVVEPPIAAIGRALFEPYRAETAGDEVVLGGYLSGLEVLGDEVVVASFDGQFVEGTACPGEARGRFHFLDRDTLAEVHTATAPYCVRDLARHPTRRQFFAVFGSPLRLGRFDGDGRLLEARDVPFPAGNVAAPLRLLVHRMSPHVSVLVEALPDRDDYVAVFSGRDASLTLEYRTISLRGPDDRGDLGDIAELDELLLSVLDRRADTIVNVDLTSPPPTYESADRSSFAEACEGIQVKVERFRRNPTHPEWLMISQGGRVHAARLESISDCVLTRFYGPVADMHDLVFWPPDDDLVLVGLSDRDEADTARLALLDRSEDRFLPTSLEIGRGPIDDMRVDDLGRVFMTLPWSGSVVRAEPK